MFFKPTDSKAILKKTFKRLMVPFLIFSVIGDLVLDLHFFLTGITSYKYYIASLKSVLIEGNAVGNVCIFIIPLLSRLLNKPDLSWTIGK